MRERVNESLATRGLGVTAANQLTIWSPYIISIVLRFAILERGVFVGQAGRYCSPIAVGGDNRRDSKTAVLFAHSPLCRLLNAAIAKLTFTKGSSLNETKCSPFVNVKEPRIVGSRDDRELDIKMFERRLSTGRSVVLRHG